MPGQIPGPALPRRQPGDHGARRARRRDAAAPAVSRVQLRRQRQRRRRDAQGGAPVPEVRRRLDQAQPVGRQLHAAVAGRDQLDDRCRGGRRDGRGAHARQARHRARALGGQRQAGAAPRHRRDLPRQLHRRRDARHARGRARPRVRRAGHRDPVRDAARGRAVGHHARPGGGRWATRTSGTTPSSR